MNDSLALASLFGSSFLSATLLPGNSEVLLVTLLTTTKITPLLLVLFATVGNTLGGLTNVIIGRFLPEKKPQRGTRTALLWLRKYGSAALLMSWLPVIGDLLCVLAGWLRMPWVAVTFFMLLGKMLRYSLLGWITLQGLAWFN